MDDKLEVDEDKINQIRRDVILGLIACLEDINVFLDLAEAYQVLPKDKIDKFRSNLDLSKM